MFTIFKNKEIKVGFISLFFCLVFILLHFPFLESDPQLEKGNFSRDALTDEGLNTAQLDNFVKTSSFGMEENNNLIKSPAFNVLLLPVSYLSTNSLSCTRLMLLVFIGALIFLLLTQVREKWWEGFIFLSLVVNFYIFQYAGFTMAESLCSFLMPVTIVLFARYFQKYERKYLLWASLSLFLIFLFKVQFLYLYFLPVLVFFLLLKKDHTSKKKDLFLFLLLNVILFSFYFFLWILPNLDLVKLVAEQEVSGRIMHPRFWTSQAFDQFCFYMLDLKNGPLFLLFCLSLIYYFFFTCKLKKDKLYYISLFALFWSIAEFHKFFIWYVPPRYLVSTLIAFSFFVFIQALILFKNKTSWKPALISAFTGILVINAFFYYQSLEKRTFVIQQENKWFKNHALEGEVIAGVWGCILAKESKAKTIPVWDGFFNDKNLLQKYNPSIIVTESDEAEAGKAFLKNGLNLDSLAKEKHFIGLGKYKITAYILK